jgi:hypothetical protein
MAQGRRAGQGLGRPVNTGERESGILLFLARKRIIARLTANGIIKMDLGYRVFSAIFDLIIGVMGVISNTGENPL